MPKNTSGSDITQDHMLQQIARKPADEVIILLGQYADAYGEFWDMLADDIETHMASDSTMLAHAPTPIDIIGEYDFEIVEQVFKIVCA